MMHFTDVLILGCNVPLSQRKTVFIALLAAIWDGLKLRACERCIIKVGHAEKSRAVSREGNGLKTGAGQSTTNFKKEFKRKMIRSRLNMAQQTVYTQLELFYHFVVLKIFIHKHSILFFKFFMWSQKWWTVCRTVYICGSGEGTGWGLCASAAKYWFILSKLKSNSGIVITALM